MKILAEQSEKIKQHFEKGKPLEKLFPLFDAIDTFLLTPGTVTRQAPHVRDVVDIKRVMILVVVALMPSLALGVYNVGYQILAAQNESITVTSAVIAGLWKVLPIIMVTYAVGGFWEGLFAILRRHEINEGFLVTGILFALTLPPTIPLWQVAVGISFGVVIGKEIFGGTGYNILNPALTARAFVFFAYPAQLSGDKVWVALDGFTRATPLGVLASADRGSSAVTVLSNEGYSFQNIMTGLIPGSIGETSTLACLLGLIFLLITGVASWRIIAGCWMGLFVMGGFLNLFQGPDAMAFFSLPPYYHAVLGSFAFGSIFMATDPVSASATNPGRWVYGFLIGVLVVLIRVVNPAYPEGVMLAILFMNVFAPTIDHFVVQNNIKRRQRRTLVRTT